MPRDYNGYLLWSVYRGIVPVVPGFHTTMTNKKPIIDARASIKRQQVARARAAAQKALSPTSTSQSTAPAVAYAKTMSATAPKISSYSSSSLQSGQRIQHKELIGTVNGSISFNVGSFVCNPGMVSTFPWLSGVADKYEQYRFIRLAFEYITRSGSNTAGSVTLAPDFDAADPPPTDEVDLSSYQGSKEDCTWRSIVCELSPASLNSKKYIRVGPVAGTDIKTYDIANFFVATVGQTGPDPIGKLWVHYDVELMIPQLAINRTPTPREISLFHATANQSWTVTQASAMLEFDETVYNPLNIATVDGVTYLLPKGSYRITMDTVLEFSGTQTPVSILGRYRFGGDVIPYTFIENSWGDCWDPVHTPPATGNYGLPFRLDAIVNSDGLSTQTFNVYITVGTDGASGSVFRTLGSKLMFFPA